MMADAEASGRFFFHSSARVFALVRSFPGGGARLSPRRRFEEVAVNLGQRRLA